MIIKWDHERLNISREEAQIKLTALVADQFRRLVREVKKRDLFGRDEILALIEEETARILGIPHEVSGTPRPTDGWVVAIKALPVDGATVGKNLFLVDRGRISTSWWTENIEDALVFRSRSAGDRRLITIKKSHPELIRYSEALIRDKENGNLYPNDFASVQ